MLIEQSPGQVPFECKSVADRPGEEGHLRRELAGLGKLAAKPPASSGARDRTDSPAPTLIQSSMNTRLKFAAGLSLAAALTSFADVKVNEMLTISGYAVGSYEYTSPDPGADTDSLFNGAKDTPSADALKVMFAFNFKPVTANVSLFYIPNIPTGAMRNELTVLDAFIT